MPLHGVDMLCLVYEFKVKPEMQDSFRSGWHSLTAVLIRECGSLGARLHRLDECTWISYAQWPDYDSWQHGEKVVFNFLQGNSWAECLQGEVKLLLTMQCTDDLLIPSVESKLEE